MTRLALATTLLALIVAVALPPGARRAYACTCVVPNTETEMARVLDFYDLVVLGAVAAPDTAGEFPNRIHVNVEKVFKGPPVEQVTLDQTWEVTQRVRALNAGSVESLGGDCSYTVLGDPGEKYVLFLKQVDETYEPGGCSSHSLQKIQTSEQPSGYLQLIDEVSAGLSEVQKSPAAEADGGDGVPWQAVATASGLAATVFAAALFLSFRRRRQRGPGGGE